MIDVVKALAGLPHFEKFCSVAELDTLAESLRADSRFAVEIAGTSEAGAPIYHVRFGGGSIKAMLVGSIHCNEPIGGLAIAGLISLLREGHPAFADADVEWHFIPCIDPDGAVLNEGWTQKPFTIESYLKGFHVQEPADQVDASFPLEYKNLHFSTPIPEALVLRSLLDKIRPDFYFPLHNALAGGAFYFLTHDIGRDQYQVFYDLLAKSGLPLETNIYHKVICDEFGDSVLRIPSMRAFYDLYEAAGAAPETLMNFGATSGEYLTEIKPEAQTLVVELPYLKHPICESQVDTGESLRQLKMRLDADNKFIATVVLEEWDKVHDDLDVDSAFYRKVLKGTVQSRDQLHEGLSASADKTRDILYNPSYGRTMTESERFSQYVFRLYTLSHVYEFVRLLKASKQTDRVQAAIARLDAIFDAALTDIARNMDVERLEIVDCDTLAQIKLGTGLVVINALLEDARKAQAEGAQSTHVDHKDVL